MAFTDWAGFLTTLGREFSEVLRKAGIKDVSGQDCFSVIADTLGTKDITPDTLRSLTPKQTAKIAAEMNLFLKPRSSTRRT